MTRHILLALFAACILAACTPASKKRAEAIIKLEEAVKESSQKNIADTAKVKELMADYISYAKAFPTDSLTPVFLMKTAKFYDFVSLPDSAIYYYDWVYRHCSYYPKTDMALFSEAFIYENEKHNISKAAMLYNEYLDKYPNSKLVKSVQFEVQNLGKTPEQVMAELDSLKRARQGDSTTAVQPKP